MPSELVSFITQDALLSHWQAHRRLTRRVIQAFPDDKLFTFSIGGMRPFGALVLEFITMAVPMVQGAVSGDWNASTNREPRPKEGIAQALGREHGAAQCALASDPAGALPGVADGVRAVPGRPARSHPLRHRQRGSPSRTGLRVSAGAWNRTAALLRSELTPAADGHNLPRRSVIDMPILNVEHVACNVSDPAAMAAWYVEHLGMRIVRRVPTPPYIHFLADASGRGSSRFTATRRTGSGLRVDASDAVPSGLCRPTIPTRPGRRWSLPVRRLSMNRRSPMDRGS